MLGYITGTLKDRQSNETLILTGGLGYLVKTPEHPRYDGLLPGESIELYLYTHVREDTFDLYGFLTPAEKQLFMTLLSVSGVGPKLGLALLSHTDEASLIDMILTEDKASLTNISGVGKKTAERMILELKDPIQKKMDQGVFKPKRSGATASVGAGASRADPTFIEAYLAIQGLGFKELQAKQMVENAIKKVPAPAKLEEIIRLALQG
jgi:Holliday junction DNA helicase RuvA